MSKMEGGTIRDFGCASAQKMLVAVATANNWIFLGCLSPYMIEFIPFLNK